MTMIERIGFMAFATIVIVIYYLEVRFAFVYVIDKLGGKTKPNPFVTRSAVVVHCFAVIGLLCILYGFFIEPYWIDVNTIEIETGKLKETNFKVVHISDMHCDEKMRNEERLVWIINAMKPDVIVFTGDSLNTHAALTRFRNTMGKLSAESGKFAVLGNMDREQWSGSPLYQGTGFELLDKSDISVNKSTESIKIYGLSVGRSDLHRQSLESTSPERFNILLHHYPDLIEDLEDFNVDLYLAGHTHGGQVALPFYGALVTLSKYGKKYEAGKYMVGKTMLYINRGIGMEGGHAPRVRFWARPEITVFNIVPKKDQDRAKVAGEKQ